jgi:peptide/nickel transport system substrate-binding protein
MSKASTSVKVAALAAASALLLAACGGSDSGDTGAGEGSSAAVTGGTLNFMTAGTQFNHLDPQMNYTGEDLAFAGAYIYRSLTWFKPSGDPATAGQLEPDLATDTGRTEDGKVWEFTLKDGLKFEDGTPITCAEVAYGVSRTFATDVIAGGPTYAITMLDIPTGEDGSSQYKGPYSGEGQELFDKAVTCSEDGKTITFNLVRPIADFNYAVTLSAFSPVPKDKDTGAKYDTAPLANGPYKIEDYTIGDSLTLVRNDQWDPATDTIRKAYPDKIVVTFGIEPPVATQRLIADSGVDQQSMTLGDAIDPAQLATVFNDPRFENRRLDEQDIYVRYLAVNTAKVPNVKHRQALAVAMPRADLRTIAGGNFAGDLADGLIKPNMAADYAPSGMWTDMFGQAIPDNGDPEFAKQLIAESGEPMPKITFDYGKTPANDKAAGAIVTALAKAGIEVTPNPLDPGGYYGIIFDDEKANELMNGGWGSDWPNASTVIPELLAANGGWNLSRWKDEAFTAESDKAKEILDRTEQGKAWAALNKQAMEQVPAIPLRFTKQQRMWGSKVGGVYFWAPYGSWGYTDLYVMP